MQYSNIVDASKQNENFRKVLFTNKLSQVVLMSLLPGEEIGIETHDDVEQILYCTEGSGKAVINGEEQEFKTGDMVVVPMDTEHNFINTGEASQKLFTIYSPPEHEAGTVHATKAEADKAE